MKIGIVGTGFVGATAAYALVMSGIGRELVLVDKNRARAEAEANDIKHAVPFAHQALLSAGDYRDLAGCRAVIISPGVSQQVGEDRLRLLQRNASVFKEAVPAILNYAPDTMLIVATNPVDVMTHLAVRFAAALGIAPNKIIGSGTMLDTARFRVLLATHLGVDPVHIHAYVLGEHGDSEVLNWSQVMVGGIPLDDFCRLQGVQIGTETRQEIDLNVRRAAYSIIEGKGSTYYGIGSALARIVRVIANDQRAIMTVCSPLAPDGRSGNVTISLPRLISGTGVVATLSPTLSPEEERGLQASADVVRTAITELGESSS
ncbi:L-lactate dehydrogenase [Geomonas sp. RF6]|uniref:L-lactate dehydrogenase n=1 Tax=Geomonas sp. RF6 TaxID=2897342 RepID=UPI001E63B272|nr:L-lactate dehydrogenase [Geomonas sp. RF6]UFS70577.1 L-lactate dehydrogenase [Geomonas sp. RF6]